LLRVDLEHFDATRIAVGYSPTSAQVRVLIRHRRTELFGVIRRSRAPQVQGLAANLSRRPLRVAIEAGEKIEVRRPARSSP
jgi:hypothetical protein